MIYSAYQKMIYMYMYVTQLAAVTHLVNSNWSWTANLKYRLLDRTYVNMLDKSAIGWSAVVYIWD